jgi:phosphoglycolate phosphatase-like HAD superfamily hydrolase
MTKKITLDLDEALLKKAELWAKQQHLSLSDVIANFLRQLPEPEILQQQEHPLAKFVGILSHAETEELQQVIKDEFEQVDTNEW